MMNVLLISGSRNPGGQTARAAEGLLVGVKEKNFEVERVFLPALDIRCCRQCNEDGWGNCSAKGACVIDDDFASVVTRLRRADCLVLATPVYYHEMSETMRAFTDRLRRTVNHPDGKVGVRGTPAIIVSVAGGGGGGAPQCCVGLQRVCEGCELAVLDTIPVRRQNLEAKMAQLRHAGAWLAAVAEEMARAKADPAAAQPRGR